jgi:hypothetical protein
LNPFYQPLQFSDDVPCIGKTAFFFNNNRVGGLFLVFSVTGSPQKQREKSLKIRYYKEFCPQRARPWIAPARGLQPKTDECEVTKVI